MNSNRSHLVNDLFKEASTLESHKRKEFLEAACAGDPQLKKDVESLLEDDDIPKGFLSKPAFEKAAGRRVVQR